MADERRVLYYYTRAEYKRIESFRFVYTIILLCYTGGGDCRMKTRVDAEVFTMYVYKAPFQYTTNIMLLRVNVSIYPDTKLLRSRTYDYSKI